MAEFTFDPQSFGSIAEIQDYIVGLTRKLNYGMTHLDSLNVKRINTNQTIITSSNGYMDLTGEQIRMYDDTGALRFRVGLSTLNVYDMTMWAEGIPTSDYDASSNASMFINSAGEAVFADTIRTKKDAIVGRNVYVGYSNSTEVKAIRLQAYDQFNVREEDLVMRTAYDGLGLLNLEFGMLYSSENSSNTLRDIETVKFHAFQSFDIIGLSLNIIGLGAGFVDIGSDTNLNINVGNLNDVRVQAKDVVLDSFGNSYLKTTDSTSKIATEGYVNEAISTLGFTPDLYVKNLSSDRQITFDYSTGSTDSIEVTFDSTKRSIVLGSDTNAMRFAFTLGVLQFFYNGVNQINTIDRALTVEGVSTNRQITFDFTTVDNNLLVSRNTTQLKSVVLSDTTQALKFNWSTAAALPSLTLNSTLVSYLARSAGQAHRFEWSAASTHLNLQVAGVSVADFIAKTECVRNVSTARQIRLDVETTGTFQFLQGVLNSTSIGYPVMSYANGQKLSMQHLTLLTTVGSVLASSGEYILVYSSGVFKGGLKLDT